MKKFLLGLLYAGFMVGDVKATLLFYDPFNYTAGQLLAPTDGSAGQFNSGAGTNWFYAGAGNPATQKPPGVASGGLSYSYLSPAPAGNSVAFDATQIGSARIQISPTAINSGTVYWSGLLSVTELGTLATNVNGMLLGGFNNSVNSGVLPTTVGAVLRIRRDSADADNLYRIGTGMNSGTGTGANGANVQFTTGTFTEGATIFVVGAYEIVAGANNDIARMWINPDLSLYGGAGSPPSSGDLISSPGVAIADSPGPIISFNLRNVNTVGAPTLLLDELRVGTTWGDVTPVPEPTVAGLLGLGLLAVVNWYRTRPR